MKIRVSKTLKKSYLNISRQVFRPFSFHLPCINIPSTRIVPYHFMYIEIVKLLQRRNSNRRVISNYWLRWSLMTRQPHNRVCHLPVSKAKTRVSFDEITVSNFKLYIVSISFVKKKKKRNRKFTRICSGRSVQEPREILGMCTHKLRCNCATPTVRKQKERDTRIQESGCDDFFLLKCEKRAKCYAIFIRSFSLTSETLSSSDRCTQFVQTIFYQSMKITIHNHAK